MTIRSRCFRALIAFATAMALPGPADSATESFATEKIDDARIENALRAKLVATRGVPGDVIRSSVSDGVATLTGRVDNLLARERALRVAKQLRGVVAVIDRIEVRPAHRPQAELLSDVIAALAADPATDSWEVGVGIDAGTVKLTGQVDSYAERDLAATVVKGVRGVVGVESDITVGWSSHRLDEEIQQDIEERMRWDIRVNSDRIEVSVHDGRVVLSGDVGSFAEREEAIGMAWVQGVNAVDAERLEVRWWARDAMERNKKWPDVTDEQMRKAIRRALLHDPRVLAFQPQVEARDGVVTLRGVVDSLKAKKAAGRDAENTIGVWYVRNLLEVRTDPVADELLEGSVRDALRRDPYLTQRSIRVSAVNGKVYLLGDVDSYFERAQAEDAVARVVGVVEVDNQLDVAYDGRDYGILDRYDDEPLESPYGFDHPSVRPSKSDSAIEAAIEAELFWSPFVNEDSIEVEVIDGEATLSGTVESWHERMAATENAFEGGASEVVNQLKIRGVMARGGRRG